MAWLLDINIIIAAVKGVPSVRAHLQKVRAIDVMLSPIVIDEPEQCRGICADTGT